MTLYSVKVLVATKSQDNYDDMWFQPLDYESWDDFSSKIESFFGVSNISVLEVLEYTGPEIFEEFNTSDDDPEQFIDQEYWDYIDQLEGHELEALQEFYNEESKLLSIDQFKTSYIGRFKSYEKFAEYDTLKNFEIPDFIKNYIDWSRVASDMFDFGSYFMTDSGYVFKSN